MNSERAYKIQSLIISIISSLNIEKLQSLEHGYFNKVKEEVENYSTQNEIEIKETEQNLKSLLAQKAINDKKIISLETIFAPQNQNNIKVKKVLLENQVDKLKRMSPITTIGLEMLDDFSQIAYLEKRLEISVFDGENIFLKLFNKVTKNESSLLELQTEYNILKEKVQSKSSMTDSEFENIYKQFQKSFKEIEDIRQSIYLIDKEIKDLELQSIKIRDEINKVDEKNKILAEIKINQNKLGQLLLNKTKNNTYSLKDKIEKSISMHLVKDLMNLDELAIDFILSITKEFDPLKYKKIQSILDDEKNENSQVQNIGLLNLNNRILDKDKDEYNNSIKLKN